METLGPLIIGLKDYSIENEELSWLSIGVVLCLVSRYGPEHSLEFVA